MDNADEFLTEANAFAALDDESARAQILHYEKETERLLAEKQIDQETAWDILFCLLHECDCRKFLKDRERILGKIDRKKYNPFCSSNPVVRAIATIRLTQAEESKMMAQYKTLQNEKN